MYSNQHIVSVNKKEVDVHHRNHLTSRTIRDKNSGSIPNSFDEFCKHSNITSFNVNNTTEEKPSSSKLLSPVSIERAPRRGRHITYF